jgi:DNA recombination protein RmuC
MEIALLAIAVLAILALGAYIVLIQPRAQEQRTAALLAQLEQDRASHERELELRLRESQTEVAQKQTESFLNLATTHLKQETELGEQTLKARQEAIDKQLEGIGKELKTVHEYVTKTDKAQAESLARVASAVKNSQEATELLQRNTQKLSEAMSGSQSRGQWGERIAEDVLRIAGFIEGVNYRKQQTTGEGSRPDFTFLLPDQRTLNMDVKMPMAAFTRYLDADSDGDRDVAAKEFLRDTKSRIKEVTTRDYINPSEGTLDYTLIFIPNEQVYGFIHEQDNTIVDYALQNHVVICSPLTLFAVLAVIRQSADNFRLESKTREIQQSIGDFRKQWDMYKEQTDKVSRAFKQTNNQWEDLVGKRERQLDKSISKIDDLRRGTEELDAPIAADVEPEVLSLLSGDDS